MHKRLGKLWSAEKHLFGTSHRLIAGDRIMIGSERGTMEKVQLFTSKDGTMFTTL